MWHLNLFSRTRVKRLDKILLGDFLPFLYKGVNFSDFLFTLLHTITPFEKGSILKGKNLLLSFKSRLRFQREGKQF